MFYHLLQKPSAVSSEIARSILEHGSQWQPRGVTNTSCTSWCLPPQPHSQTQSNKSKKYSRAVKLEPIKAASNPRPVTDITVGNGNSSKSQTMIKVIYRAALPTPLGHRGWSPRPLDSYEPKMETFLSNFRRRKLLLRGMSRHSWFWCNGHFHHGITAIK